MSITANSAAQKGGGLAVENDSENGKPSYVVRTSYQIADASYVNNTITNNTAPIDADISGIDTDISTNSLNESVPNPTIIGSPAPYPSPPESSQQYKGAVDQNAFCQAKLYQSVKIPTPYDPYVLQCISATAAKAFTPLEACQWKTGLKDVMTRLADYYDPSSWQCYAHEKELGPIYNLDGFCKGQGYQGTIQTGKTAYNWKCVLSTGDYIGLSVTNACQWLYGNTAALDSLVNFNTPNGWECWAPA